METDVKHTQLLLNLGWSHGRKRQRLGGWLSEATPQYARPSRWLCTFFTPMYFTPQLYMAQFPNAIQESVFLTHCECAREWVHVCVCVLDTRDTVGASTRCKHVEARGGRRIEYLSLFFSALFP